MIFFLLLAACSCGPSMDHAAAVAFIEREHPDVRYEVDLEVAIGEANLRCAPCGEPRPACGVVDAYVGAGWVTASCDGFRRADGTPRRMGLGKQVPGRVHTPGSGDAFPCDGDRHVIVADVVLEPDEQGQKLKQHGLDLDAMKWTLSAPVQCAGGKWETSAAWVVE